ncbi:MAG: NAD(P)/FAD-dependent oxidoreductase [Phycisphaerales bacterium]|nr:NAD(P)/FAD-dependent oxidoreductase [Phycisphaerales bacterium]
MDKKRVLIIGGGFGGLACARALKRADVRVTLIDRRNHHLFQPLLYQVATAGLNPADIAVPIRHVLRRQKNADVVLAEVESIDPDARLLALSTGESVGYDYLVVASGAGNTWFGHAGWAVHAPGLKDLPDALTIRQRFLTAFERAEMEDDRAMRRAELTFVVVGGGPTGVELAGAMAEIARRSVPKDFRRIDTTTARIILIESGERLLDAFDAELGRRARADLERLGVDVWLNSRVTEIGDGFVAMGDERVTTRCVVWAAGVKASPLGGMLGVELHRSGRVPVRADLSVEGHPEVFVIGDLAHSEMKDGGDVPGVAPAAMQMGRFAARTIRREVGRGGDAGARGARGAFRYVDKGMLATIGRRKAVGSVGKFRFTGALAWFVWLFVHILFLIGFRNRVLVVFQWAWAYFTFDRGARLITEHQSDRIENETRRESPVGVG